MSKFKALCLFFCPVEIWHTWAVNFSSCFYLIYLCLNNLLLFFSPPLYCCTRGYYYYIFCLEINYLPLSFYTPPIIYDPETPIIFLLATCSHIWWNEACLVITNTQQIMLRGKSFLQPLLLHGGFLQALEPFESSCSLVLQEDDLTPKWQVCFVSLLHA